MIFKFLPNILKIDSSGSKCSSSLRLSIQDQSKPRGVKTVHQFCSPLNLGPVLANSENERNHPVIINSSLVFLDFQTSNPKEDYFTGAFEFHNGQRFIIAQQVNYNFHLSSNWWSTQPPLNVRPNCKRRRIFLLAKTEGENFYSWLLATDGNCYRFFEV